jgi:hypothetical protein
MHFSIKLGFEKKLLAKTYQEDYFTKIYAAVRKISFNKWKHTNPHNIFKEI